MNIWTITLSISPGSNMWDMQIKQGDGAVVTSCRAPKDVVLAALSAWATQKRE